jgi:UDPglucose 6-dehydrogenase
MRIAMIGAGYVGLVSGACFSDFGHHVICIDSDEEKLAALKSGKIPIHEPGLTDLVVSNVRQGRLAFGNDMKSAVGNAEVVFIAVGTPSRGGDGHADLSYVYAAAREIAKGLSKFAVVVTKSTVPVGTSDEVERLMREENPDAEFAVVSNPEFLRKGAAIRDFKHPDRIVIGTDDARARGILTEVYRPLHLSAPPILYTDRRTAELTKYAANLATKVAFINEIADLAEKVGANVQEVARGIGLDNRIGSKFLHAGPGFGGFCFPKDTMALIKTGQDNETPLRIIETVVAVNDQRKRAMMKWQTRSAAMAICGENRSRCWASRSNGIVIAI